MEILVDKKKFIASYQNKKLGEYAFRKKKIKPVKVSRELAGIVGDLMSDGHIGSNMVIFSSNSASSLKDFGKRTKKIFGITYSIKPVVTNTYGVKNLYIFDNSLVRILNICGVPIGNKALKEYKIPTWINTNEKFMREFLSRLFDNDGCVTCSRNRVRIKINFQKAESLLDDNYKFLESIRSFLSKHEIKSTNVYKCGYYMRKDGIRTLGLGFEIQGTRKTLKSVIKFYNFIGLNNKVKKKKLEAFIKDASGSAPVANVGIV